MPAPDARRANAPVLLAAAIPPRPARTGGLAPPVRRPPCSGLAQAGRSPACGGRASSPERSRARQPVPSRPGRTVRDRPEPNLARTGRRRVPVARWPLPPDGAARDRAGCHARRPGLASGAAPKPPCQAQAPAGTAEWRNQPGLAARGALPPQRKRWHPAATQGLARRSLTQRSPLFPLGRAARQPAEGRPAPRSAVPSGALGICLASAGRAIGTRRDYTIPGAEECRFPARDLLDAPISRRSARGCVAVVCDRALRSLPVRRTGPPRPRRSRADAGRVEAGEGAECDRKRLHRG